MKFVFRLTDRQTDGAEPEEKGLKSKKKKEKMISVTFYCQKGEGKSKIVLS